jgi:hypothetical protein
MVFLLTFPISGPRLSLEQARDAVKNIVSQSESMREVDVKADAFL